MTSARNASPAAFHLPERQATSPADCASRGPGAFYAVAAASGFGPADVPPFNPSREGCDSIPAPISAFVDAWVAPGVKAAPAVRDFSFKDVIGEPSW